MESLLMSNSRSVTILLKRDSSGGVFILKIWKILNAMYTLFSKFLRTTIM